MALIDKVKAQEGFKSHPYTDSVGKLTIGYGFNIAPDGPGLTAEECSYVLTIRLTKVHADVFNALPWFRGLNTARADVLVDMAYNMGLNGLLGFHRMLAMAEVGNYEGAAAAGLESKWATQVGQRAKDLMEQLRTGVEK